MDFISQGEGNVVARYETYKSQLDDTDIRSYFAAPSGTGRYPTVLMLRGVAGPDDGYTLIADQLVEAGYAALVHRWQVRGDDPDDRTLIADIGSAIGFLRDRAEVDADRLVVFGYCKGGGQALLAAEAFGDIRAIVVFHGLARRRQGADDDRKNPIDAASGVTCPAMVLHGEQDQPSPIEGMRELTAALTQAGSETQFHVYPDVDHGFAVSTHPGYEVNSAADSLARAVKFLSQHQI